jgi:undecaprenyl-diphosphatase
MRPSIRTILIVMTGTAAALALDMSAHRFVLAYIVPHQKASLVSQIIYGFQDFAQTIPLLTTGWLVWRLDRQNGRSVVLRLVLALILAGAVSGLAKSLVGRHRPEPFRGQTWQEAWIDIGLRDRSSKQESFFSGHSTAAFAVATIVATCYPPVRPVVYTLAVGCAASRVASQQHWLSDAYIGSVAGMALGWVLLPARLRRGRHDKGLLHGKFAGQMVGSSSN